MIEHPRLYLNPLEVREQTYQELIPEVVMNLIRTWCVNYLKSHYEEAGDPRTHLAYHDSMHSQRVAIDTAHILSLVRSTHPDLVSERDIQLGEIAGLTHDLIQQWSIKTSNVAGFIKIEKDRKTGFNERASAVLAVRIMKDINESLGVDIFTDQDFHRLKVAICTTIPDFDSVHQTVFQPYLALTADPIAIALALADLGGGAIDAGERFQLEGDSYFRELNDDVAIYIRKGVTLSSLHQENIKKRILDWSTSQIAFAQGRKYRLADEINLLPLLSRESVALFMNRWDEAIVSAQMRLADRQYMTFSQLLKDIGYI